MPEADICPDIQLYLILMELGGGVTATLEKEH